MGPTDHLFVLGSGGPCRDHLRGGALAFQSHHGLPAELALLIDALPGRPPGHVLVGQDRDGACALAARRLWPEAALRDHHVDAYLAARARATLQAHGMADVEVVVSAHLPRPDGPPFDLVALPFPSRGESLLAREWVEEAHDRLRCGGRFLASCDGSPSWLRKVVREVFGHVDLQRFERRRGAVLAARRQRERTRCPSRFRTVRLVRAGRELVLRTCPGVFSHGRLDPGTRALLRSFTARPGDRVLDLGCGAGALGLAAAVDAGAEGVVMVDSNARAAEVAGANARANGFPGATVCLRADLEDLPGDPFDLVLANPPYFSRGRIAASFSRVAARNLAKGGRFLLVAKDVERHRVLLERDFRSVRVGTEGGYGILRAAEPRA